MAQRQWVEEALSRSVIGAFYEVYNALGYGFLEHLYVKALEWELLDRGHRVSRQVGVRVTYKERELGCQRLDLIVDDTLVVEAKSCEVIRRGSTRQLFNYLHATNLEVGLLLHFGPEPKFYPVICPHPPH